MTTKTACLDFGATPITQPKVTVEKHYVDWGNVGWATESRRSDIQRAARPGYWYLNPMFTVYCHQICGLFFRRARQCQAAWFRFLGRHQRGYRNLMRATTDLAERMLQFNGVLILNGTEIDPEDWNEIEKKLGIHPRYEMREDMYHYVKQRSWHILEEISRGDLEEHLNQTENSAIYVTPAMTVRALWAGREFYDQAQVASNMWHATVARHFEPKKLREMYRHIGWRSKMLVFHGALIVDGEAYLPGFWPNQCLVECKLKQTPRGTRTVPLEYLGLRPQYAAPAIPHIRPMQPTNLAGLDSISQ